DMARVSLTIHLELLGPGGGDATLTIDHGRLRISRGIPRPPDAVLSLRASTFLDMLSGRTSFATALLVGAIRAEREPIGTQVLMAMVELFLAQSRRSGARAWPARQLARWFQRDARATREAASTQGASA